MLLVKKCQFFVYLGLVKIRQEIMLNDFAEKRETFSTLKDRIFQSPKNALFQRGYPMLLVKKCHFFNLFRFGQNKSRNNA